jgi:type IV pilus assembly protein PilY1
VVGAPAITLDYRNNLWVYFGTGRFYNQLDEADLTIQRFFGVKDDGGLINLADLYDVTNVTVRGDTAYVGGSPMPYDSLMSLIEARKGWYRNFSIPPGVGVGERCWTKPLVIGGAVVFTTGTPSGGDVCLFGGTGDLYALFYLTGAAYKTPILGKNVAGEHMVKVSLGSGIPAGAGLYIGSDREKAFFQSATGGIRGIQMRLPFSPREGVQVYKRR